MILTNNSLAPTEIVRILGLRFRDYRMRMNMTRKQISDQAAIGMTTLYKFETGHITDISLTTLIKLMRSVGLYDAWEQFLPELPESPYLYDDNFKKRQRIRNSKK